MCGRVRIDDDGTAIANAIGASLGAGGATFIPGEYHPNGECLVAISVRTAEASVVRLGPLRWGFALPGSAGGRPRYVHHARLETAATLPLFAESAARRRAFLPVTAFDEWNPSRERFSSQSEDGVLLRVAALWAGKSFVVVTRSAPVGTPEAEVHPRLPLLVPSALVEEWLGLAPFNDIVAEVQKAPVRTRFARVGPPSPQRNFEFRPR